MSTLEDSNRKKNISRSGRAGLVLPVGRLARMLKKGQYAKRIGSSAPVYLCAVLEYLVTEVLDMAADMARKNKRLRITPRHIMLVIRGDEELNSILENVVFANSGVRPSIHPMLLPVSSRKKAASVEDEESSADGEDAAESDKNIGPSQDF
ncbi:histone H2A-beta, sperm [Galendromus occidentalis]|uniref:Histone H2A n=1 Tax=Galendromus occidentalis TaxID=34638 RepID=A0AAJ6QV92_9ACAR|nr:histone H2A-beta, sperm [Galendromus occidentalis]